MKIPVFELSGSPFERGVAYGTAHREGVQRAVAHHRAHVEQMRERRVLPSEEEGFIAEHAAIVEADLPDLAEEIRGLAQGAEIAYLDAIGLQMLRERIRGRAAADCTSIAWAGRAPTLAQTVDLAGDMGPFGIVQRIRGPGGPSILMFTFAGMLGYLGLNEAGLAVGINMVLSDDWRPGVSPYLLVRHLLSMSSLDDCEAALRRVRRSSSRILTVCHQERVVRFEMTATQLRLTRGDQLFCTNHYLHPELVEQDRINILSRNSSLRRLQRVEELVRAVKTLPTPSELFEVLSDHSIWPVGICAHAEGDTRRSDTVAAVVLLPVERRMQVRWGHPCSSPTEHLELN